MQRPRTLLFLVTEDWYFASHRLPVARAARDAGWHVIVATRVQNHGAFLESEGFKVIPLTWRRTANSVPNLILDVLAIANLYRREKPDLVHHVALKPVLVGAAAARLAGVAHVVNAITGFGYVAGGETDGQRVTKSRLMRVLPRLTHRPESVLLLQNADDYAFALSQKLAEPAQTQVIQGSGVDTGHFQPLLEPEGPEITVGFVGRMLVQKGVEDLVTAIRTVQQQRPDIKLLLAGNPDPENPASFTRQTLEDWGKDSGIAWRGHVEDVRTVWQEADIACIPSRGGEGVPKALLEAGACGRPIIATDVPGCRDVIANGSSGTLVSPGDPNALAAEILRLADDAERRRRYAVAIRETVETHFAEPAIVEQTLALYERITA